MKLQKFKEKDNKKVMIIVFSVCCILLIVGVIFYNSFALYEQKKDFNVINGNIVDSGDLNFVYYIDENITFSIPSKKEGYRFNSKSYCTNGVTVKWNHGEWKAILDFANYKEEEEKIKCHIHFDTSSTGPAVTYILNLSETSEELVHDNTNEDNVRYVGKNPNNYVSFNNELWRIVGVFHDVKDENGMSGSRLKLIRKEDIGAYSWHETSRNDWTTSAIMKLLNPGYDEESVNNSLYWNKEQGKCHTSAFTNPSTCDFSSTGISDDNKHFIDEVIWPLGGSSKIDNSAAEFYESEHEDKVYINNKSIWNGKIGLVNPSDYGYATNGGSSLSRENCLNVSLSKWNTSEYNDCKANNWLLSEKTSYETWTMHHMIGSPHNVFTISRYGNVKIGEPKCAADSDAGVLDSQYIQPVIFLKESVEITSGDGTESNPYKIYNSDWQKVDYIKPNAKITLTRNGNDVIVDASKSTDNMGIQKYYYSIDEVNWFESSESTYTFHEEETNYKYGKATSLVVDYASQKIKKVYVKVEDKSGNKSSTYETIGPVFENGSNVSYVGKNPDNYVLFNNELWRIIGTTYDTIYRSYVKIIRAEDIGSYSWSATYVDSWINSDLYMVLNPGFANNEIGSSAYWNKTKAMCYTSYDEHSEVCDFSNIGLEYKARSMLESGVGYATIDLINPEDYEIATEGGTNIGREECLKSKFSIWNTPELSDCKDNNWLYNSNKSRWTIHTNNSDKVFILSTDGSVQLASNIVSGKEVGHAMSYAVQPVGYLKTSINIISGTGTKTDPFILENTNPQSDNVKPRAKMNVAKKNDLVTIDASESSDNDAVAKYFYSKDGENWIESTSSTYNFKENVSLTYGKGIEAINNLYNQYINRVYLYVEDKSGNKSDIVTKNVENGNLIKDETEDNNIRYIGTNANNYVDFNGEKWRIIGVMNNIDNGTGTKEQRIKIIRDESIGKYSYDTSSNQTSSFSYGINNWNTSKLMKLLNGGYNEESIGGSLYWNRTNGNCYNGLNNSSTTCNFSSTGLTNDAKNMIGKAVWNLGGSDSNGWNLTVKKYYISERSTEVYQGNDTTWTGEVGLMYPSDYGFSISGNETTTRESCLEKGMFYWSSDDCALNSWIYNEKNGRESLMQPSNETNYNIFVIQSAGSVSLWNMECSAFYEDTVSAAQTVRPVVYLKNTVKIVSGTGTKEDSFQLSL